MNDNKELFELNSEAIEEALKAAEIPRRGNSLSKPAVAVVSAVATLIICIVAVAIAYGVSYNSYNANKDGYLPTLANLAEEYDMTVDEVKEAYGLPKNMRGDTVTAVALNYMPAGLYVEMNYGLPFDMAVEAMGLSEDERISPQMIYGEFEKILEEQDISQPIEPEMSEDAEQVPEETATAE